MSSLLILGTATSCNVNSTDEAVIEKPEIKIENGQLTPEALLAFGVVSEPKMSPDGSKILYGVKYASIEQDKSNNELWTMDADGSNATRITKTASSEQNAVWFDGGKKIAFLYKDGDNVQLWTMDADGLNRKVASKIETGIDGFVLSPDETKVAFISSIQYGKTTAEIYPDMKQSSARIIDDMMYKHWDEWVTTIPHSFIADFDGKEIANPVDMLENEPYEAPMKPFGGVESLAWAPDGKSVIYVSRKKTGKEYALSTNSDLYQYDIASKKTKNLTEGMIGYDTNPAFSKSGNYLAWLSMEHDGYESDKNRIFIMNMKTGEKTDLTANWDYSVDAIAWTPDEKALIFTAPFQGTIPMFKIDINSQAIDTLAAGQYDYAGIEPIEGNKVLTMRHSMKEPNEIFSIASNDIKQLTNINTELLSQLDSIDVKKVMVPTTDGKLMTTWVVYPPKFNPEKKYPAILYCQGGPQSPVSQFWSSRWNLRLMAANGYIVIAPNRRGLPGFGTEWNEQISGDYPGQNMKDYLSAVDFMKKESYIDGEHIGAVGASYGGFSVYWLAGNSNHRFAALIAHAGIFNTEAQYLETEEMWFANWDLGGPFWDKDNKVAQRTFASSPHKFVQNWETPIMITVGEKDYRILASQGMMAFNAARLRDIPTKMVIFPDENHWILRSQNAIVWQREFFGWLDKWLKPNKNEVHQS